MPPFDAIVALSSLLLFYDVFFSNRMIIKRVCQHRAKLVPVCQTAAFTWFQILLLYLSHNASI